MNQGVVDCVKYYNQSADRVFVWSVANHSRWNDWQYPDSVIIKGNTALYPQAKGTIQYWLQYWGLYMHQPWTYFSVHISVSCGVVYWGHLGCRQLTCSALRGCGVTLGVDKYWLIIIAYSYTLLTLHVCSSQSEMTILKKTGTRSARALFLYNCTPNSSHSAGTGVSVT